MSYGQNEGKTLNIRKLTRKYGLKIIEDKDSLRIENDFNWSNSGFFVFIIAFGTIAILAAFYHCMTVEQAHPIEIIGKFLLPFALVIPIYMIIEELNFFVSLDNFEIKIYKPFGTKVIPYNSKHKIILRQNTFTESGKYSDDTYLKIKIVLKTQNAEVKLFQFSDLEIDSHETRQLANQLAGLMRRKMLSFNGNIQM